MVLLAEKKSGQDEDIDRSQRTPISSIGYGLFYFALLCFGVVIVMHYLLHPNSTTTFSRQLNSIRHRTGLIDIIPYIFYW